MTTTEHLILFTRYPEAGVTKTRLIPALGPAGAADLQRRMTDHVIARALALIQSRKVSVEVRFEGGSEERMRGWLGNSPQYCRQGPGDIGARMRRALGASFNEGIERAVLIGSDIPGITTTILASAFDQLESVDLVLGPAADGGYYLVGLQHSAWAAAADGFFRDVPWGTERVLAVTREKIASLGLQAVFLETLADIDRPEDLTLWEQLCR